MATILEPIRPREFSSKARIPCFRSSRPNNVLSPFCDYFQNKGQTRQTNYTFNSREYDGKWIGVPPDEVPRDTKNESFMPAAENETNLNGLRSRAAKKFTKGADNFVGPLLKRVAKRGADALDTVQYFCVFEIL